MHRVCCCLLLQDLCKSCAREESEERGRVLWDATSRGLCGRVGDHHALMYVYRPLQSARYYYPGLTVGSSICLAS